MFDSEGVEHEVFTQEEVDTAHEELTQKVTDAETATTEAKDHLKEKTDEFIKAKQGHKRFSELSEEEKKQMTTDQLATMEQLDELKVNQETERTNSKEAFFVAAAQGDEKVLEKLKENYEIMNMPETTTAEIQARINRALPMTYNDLGITERKPVSLGSVIVGGGAAPATEGEGEKKKFSETDKGKAIDKEIFGAVLPVKKDDDK